MAHFRGIVRGMKGADASRLGNKDSGLTCEAAGWQGKVCVYMTHDARTGLDMVEVTLEAHHGAGCPQPVTVYRGPVGEYRPEELFSRA